jgi:hypothetical protein
MIPKWQMAGLTILVLISFAGGIYGFPKATQRAHAIGDDLVLSLTNGKIIRLHGDRKDCDDGNDQCTFYKFESAPPTSHWFSIFKGAYEGGDYFLIDADTGRKTDVPYKPLFSTDASRFLILNDDVTGNFPGDSIEIWRRERDRAVREWSSNLGETETGVRSDSYQTKIQHWDGEAINISITTEDQIDKNKQFVAGRKWIGTIKHLTDGWHMNARAPN